MGTASRKILVAALAVGAAAVVLVVAGIALVMTTPIGAKYALRYAADFLPGDLSVGEVAGSVVTGLELRDVHYRADGIGASARRLDVEADLRALSDRRLVLDRVYVEGGTLTLSDSPEPPAQVSSDAAAEPGLLPEMPEMLVVRDLRIDDLRIEGLAAPLHVRTLTGALGDSRLDITAVELEAGGAVLEAALEAEIDAGQAAGSLAATLRLPPAAPASDASTAPAGDAEILAIDADFHFVDTDGVAPWRASLEWARLEWLRPGAAPLTSSDGRVTVAPEGDALGIELQASIEGEPLPAPASLTASGAFSGETVTIARARVELAEVEAILSGAVHLDGPTGYVSIDYRGVDPSIVDDRMQGDLAGRIDAAFTMEPALRITGSGNIVGQLDGRPLDGRIVASYADESLAIERATVTLDDGRIEVDGGLSPESADLRFSASVPRLDDWYPGASGAVTAAGSLTGDPDNPAVEIDLDAENLTWDAAGMPALERLALRVGGTRASHRLRVEAATAPAQVVLELEQSYADGAVGGTLRDSVLTTEGLGVWRLAAPADYSAALDDLAIEPACLIGPGEGRLCVALTGDTLTVEAREVPNALAEPWLPGGLRLAGTTDGDVSVTLGGPLAGSASLRHRSLAIGIEADAADAPTANGSSDAGGVTQLIDLEDVLVSAVIDAQALDIIIEPGPDTRTRPPLEGRLTLSPPSAEGQLEGFLVARVDELAIVESLVDGVESLRGLIEARVEIGGTIDAPRFAGRIEATGLEAELPPLGITVEDGRLAADLADLEAVPFDGELCSRGCARLAGVLSLPRDDDWVLTASIDGENVLLIDQPELAAIATPALEVRATPELASVTGTLGIQEGLIAVEDVPRSAVRPSRETVVHGREEPPPDAAGLPVPLALQVRATLGAVRFDGLGLEAELDGTLDVERTPAGQWNVQGTTTIEEGSFTAYGQTLTIEQGLLVFTGPPDNPTLDIRATRIVQGDQVGLHITGTSQDPRSEVFSQTGLPESEAFAQLVTGRSLSNLGESDPEALERAAIGLGLRRALPTLGRIGASLGLDELGIDASGETEGAVVAGRRIGDDVYLRYRYGLFDDFSGLELIYRITRRFRLRTETGTAQAIDLIYEMERGGPDSLEDDVQDIDVAIRDRSRRSTELLGPDVDAR
jgi:translocation and assembly module TamB